MDWPLVTDYTAMLQNPAIAFADPHLRVCRIRRDAHNQPLAICGQFAAVFQAESPEGQRLAIRVFTSDREERAERYQQISDYLLARSDFPALVRFTYSEKSVRAVCRDGRARLYPLIVMDWVSGDTLYDWVRKRCAERASERIWQLADHWFHLAAALEAAEIGHGDLQHGNVLVAENDELKLVDYDGMCVPALLGCRNLETGMTPYQHPGRGDYTPLSPSIDRFSALFIYAAVRALAAAPRLWADHVESRRYDKLFFMHEDLVAPGRSALFSDIRRLADPEVTFWTDALVEAFQGPLDNVRPLSEIEARRPATLSASRGYSPSDVFPPEDAKHDVPQLSAAANHPSTGQDGSTVAAMLNVTPPQELPPLSALTMSSCAVEPVMARQSQPTPRTTMPSSTALPEAPSPGPPVPQRQPESLQPSCDGESLLAALSGNDLMTFCENFDVRVIREHPEKFEAFGQRLMQWARSQFRFCDKIGLAVTRGRDSIAAVPGAKDSCLLRWSWPPSRFSETCLLGLARGSVASESSPDDLQLDMRRLIKRDLYESGRGIIVRLDRLTIDCHAVVWAVLDFGFGTIYSDPLLLGSLRRATRVAPRKTSWW